MMPSNRESGYGRYDVMLEPVKGEGDAIIMEFKVHDLEEESTLKDTVEAALAQIEEKGYGLRYNETININDRRFKSSIKKNIRGGNK